MEDKFPIQGCWSRKHWKQIPASNIPWDMIAPHEAQALVNHCRQTLKELARRGGLSHCEAIAVLEDRPWHQMDLDQSVEKLAAMVTAHRIRRENMNEQNKIRAEEQIAQLADFIIAEVPGEPSQDEGAVECAIRIIRAGLRITASEALFGFAAWLTCRFPPLLVGSTENAAPMADLVQKWCDANSLLEPRDGVYPKNIKQPDAK